jgi:hypothetical protein
MFLPIILVLACACAGAAANAAPPAAQQPQDEAFTAFYEEFRDAVKFAEKNRVAGLTDFEKFTWEANEDFKVKDRASFLENYNDMFTAAIRDRIETADPVKIDDNSWSINWRMQGTEYSLRFYRKGKGGFRFSGLAVGPY